MHLKRTFQRVKRLQAAALTSVGVVLMVVSCTHLSSAQKSAQKPAQKTFASAQEASHALFVAVQSGDEQKLMEILGGGKELVSCDDELQDQSDREQFAKKYEEMHRLVRDKDGTTRLYVGAENWPFPVPIVPRAGEWYFDSENGAREILFRRVGENEATAIEICHALVQANKVGQYQEAADDPIAQYARTLVSASRTNAGSATEDGVEKSTPFHGYYFRMLGTNESKGTSGGFAYVAYPAEYRSSGVLTFVVGQDGLVREADLGPNTAKTAKMMTAWKPSSRWHVVE